MRTNSIIAKTCYTLLLSFFVYISISLFPYTLSFAEKRPEWIDGASLFYPQIEYLIGVGYGDTIDKAEKEAYASISKIFLVRVTQHTMERERHIQDEKGGKIEIVRQVDIDQITNISTDKILEDVTISERWFDKASNIHYVLATLNRSHASLFLKEKISLLDKKTAELIGIADNSTEKLHRIRSLKRAVNALLLRDIYNSDLIIINPEGKGVKEKISIIDISNRLEEILSRELNIVLEIEGDNDNRLNRYIMEAIGKRGLSVKDGKNTEEIDIKIKGRIYIKDAGIDDPPWKYLRWEASFSITDIKRGKIFGSITKSGREGALSKERAKNKVFKALQDKVADEIGKRLTDFIFGTE
ncbi:MAG: LPP20 family lipoprotein [Nitrospirota bacterium]